MLKKIIIILVAVAVIGVLGLYYLRNYLVEAAVEKSCTYALGTDTYLSTAVLELGGGSLELIDLAIRNPEGFEKRDFMTMSRGVIDIDAGSIFDDEVVIDSFVIEGVNLNLEQIDSRGNYKVLMDNFSKIDLGESESTQRFKIGMLSMRDIDVSGSLSVLDNLAEKSYRVDDITLRNVGSDAGATIGELTQTVVQTIVKRAFTEGGGLLPHGFGEKIRDQADEKIQDLKDEATDELTEAGKKLLGR